MAEFQLAGLVADLVHGEVHDPAEGVLLLVHMAGDGGAQGLDQHTGGLEGGVPLACGQGHEVVGLQVQGLDDLFLDGADELGDTAHQLAVFIHAEPVGLAAGHGLHIRQCLVDELPGLVEIADLYGFHQIAPGKGLKAAAAQHGGDVLHPQVDPQVRLVGAVILHSLGVGDAGEGGRCLARSVSAQYGADRPGQAAPPFTRIPYTEAMENYGSDKPDLRIDLRVQDVTAVLGGCGFEPFAGGNLVKAVKVSNFHETRKFIDKTLADVETVSGGKAYWFRMDENGELVGGISKFVSPIKEKVIEALDLKANDFVALSAGKRDAALKTAGVLVKTLGAAVPGHMDKEQYAFCWIVDFPMYEIGDESGELEFCHNPFSMPCRRPGRAAEGRAGRDRSPEHHCRPV